MRRLALLCLPAALLFAAPAHAADRVEYVALGDSYTAGPLTSFLQPGSPLGCVRGDRNYPSLVAAKLKPAVFKDVSCSGAQVKHMTEPQNFSIGAPNPPQLDSLTPTTTLVTLTIGGNDMGFSKAVRCFQVSFSAPDASPCKDQLTADGVNPFHAAIERAAPRVATMFQEIHRRAPQAKVFLLTYPQVLPQGSGCFPFVPVAKGDVPFLRDAQAVLNTMLTTQAQANGATVVDLSEDGHDSCQPDPAKRWIEGIPTQWAAPAHPNQNGETAMAAHLLAALAV